MLISIHAGCLQRQCLRDPAGLQLEGLLRPYLEAQGLKIICTAVGRLLKTVLHGSFLNSICKGLLGSQGKSETQLRL